MLYRFLNYTKKTPWMYRVSIVCVALVVPPIWLVAKDVYDILGFRDAYTGVRGLDADEKKLMILPTQNVCIEREQYVINESGFYSLVLKSKRHATGRSTTQYANLFVGIAKCGSCGGTMIYESKGAGYEYLLCSEARRRFNCKRHTWKNQQAKAHIMMNLAELDCRSLFPDVYGKTQDAVTEIKGDILVKEAEL